MRSAHDAYLEVLPQCWSTHPLREICTSIVSGGTPSRSNPAYWGGSIPWVTPGELTKHVGKYLFATNERITEAGLASSGARLVPRDSLLVTTRATLGSVALAAMPVATNQGFKSALFGAESDPTFYYHLLGRLKPELTRRASGTTFLEISGSEFQEVVLPAPPLEEQRRIAALLDTLDDAIRFTARVIAKLEKVRQGLLNDLLTYGVTDNGQVRHRYGSGEVLQTGRFLPRGWRVAGLKDFVSNLDGTRVPLRQTDRDRRHGEYRYFGASGVIDYVDDFLFDGHFILLGEDGENVVSRQLPLAFRVSGKFWVNNHAHVLKPLPGHDIRFLTYLLDYTDYKPVVIGSAQPKLTQAGLSALRFHIPKFDEQVRIAEIMEAYEARRKAETLQLEKLVFLKAGLADDLLTGRVRVNLDDEDAA